MTYKLMLKYDGTNYHGWQRQKNAITIQEVLENVMEDIFSEKVNITGCSRTDQGVHAQMYVCSFSVKTTIPTEKIHIVLNTKLPMDIRAYRCEQVSESFNARFDTVKKTYEYKILNSEVCDPCSRNYVWHYPINLDIDKMQKAASIIKGKKDFKAFCAAGSIVKSTVRNLMELSVTKENELITIRATADGFLYNMVRILTGTLVYVGNGKINLEDIKMLIETNDRRLMGITAPPQGLALVEVVYE